MTFTINASDNEFAVATGSNVNSGPGTSTFDYPPTSSTGLIITANDGDPSPGTFSVGDTYDLVYGNGGGGKGGTFEDAVVIRSDALPGGGHAVVFEGVNQDGDLEQIVWTPGFDLETWYFDNFNQGNSPQFYTSDQSAETEYQHAYVCLSSDTVITTAKGEIPIGQVRVGDLVLTMDHGLRPVLWIGRRIVRVDQKSRNTLPILVPPTILQNGIMRRQVIVSPQHRLLLRTPHGQEILAPAKAFVGSNGIRYMRGRREVEYNTLLFAQHEVIDASGLAVESFLPGPQGYRWLSARELVEVERVVASTNNGQTEHRMQAARPCLGGSSGQRAVAAGAHLVAFDPNRISSKTQVG